LPSYEPVKLPPTSAEIDAADAVKKQAADAVAAARLQKIQDTPMVNAVENFGSNLWKGAKAGIAGYGEGLAAGKEKQWMPLISGLLGAGIGAGSGYGGLGNALGFGAASGLNAYQKQMEFGQKEEEVQNTANQIAAYKSLQGRGLDYKGPEMMINQRQLDIQMQEVLNGRMTIEASTFRTKAELLNYMTGRISSLASSGQAVPTELTNGAAQLAGEISGGVNSLQNKLNGTTAKPGKPIDFGYGAAPERPSKLVTAEDYDKLQAYSAFYNDSAGAEAARSRAAEMRVQNKTSGTQFSPTGEVVLTPGALSTSLQIGSAEAQAATAVKNLEAERASVASGRDMLNQLANLQVQVDSLPDKGPITQGPLSATVVDYAKNINGLSAILGGQPVFNTGNVAAVEAAMKDTTRLGFSVSKSMGREPGFIVQQAISATPSVLNTKEGFRRIAAGMRQAVQYQNDHVAAAEAYSKIDPTMSGFEIKFSADHPTQAYINEAKFDSVNPGVLESIKSHLKTNGFPPSVRARVDQEYGSGTSAIIAQKLGIK
jgi:hypothetical protein